MSDGPEHVGPRPLAGYVVRDYDDLIARLARSRESQGITMRELTRRCAVGIGTISEALRGAIDPSASRLVALIDALGYDLALIPREQPKAAPICGKCGYPLAECIECGNPGLCGEAHCGDHLPDGEIASALIPRKDTP